MKKRGRRAAGVATPLLITGPIHGLRFVAPPASTPYGVLDCRLVLTLERLAQLLAEHDVIAMYVDNYHRPKAHLPGRRKKSQHAYGLAADITAFRLADGRRLVVERDWHAAIGDPVCGPEAVMTEPNEDAIALRNLVCAVARAGLFHHLLTPSFDRAHRNHFHFDIKRDGRRRSLR
ncbi:MAG: extensin family protein [Deltaproteobacteria bacterium]|nr:extensin family protein [Deltaproteobacteria bacterium]